MTPLKVIFLQVTIQPFLTNLVNLVKLYQTYAHFSIFPLDLYQMSNFKSTECSFISSGQNKKFLDIRHSLSYQQKPKVFIHKVFQLGVCATSPDRRSTMKSQWGAKKQSHQSSRSPWKLYLNVNCILFGGKF